MNGKNNILPKHWQIKKLRDVCKELQSGKRPKGGVQGIESGIPSLGAEHLNYNGGFKFEKIKFVPKDFAEQMIKGIIKNDDIIIVKDGATTGKTSFVGNDFPYKYAVINEHVFIVRLTNEVLPRFAFYRLFCSTGHKEILEDFRGAAQGGISSGFLDKVNIPYPKIPEQQAIVSKIEELLSDLENGKQQLLTAKQQLKVYRQSLLKWAFEGKLTNNNVKEGGLPKGWKWLKIESLLLDKKKGMATGPFGTMLKKSEHKPNGIPVLGIENIGEGVFQMPNKIFITKEKSIELKNFRVKENDIIISRSGTVGEICLLPKNMEGSIISTNLIRVSLNQEIIYPKYFVYLFQGGKVRQQVFELCKGSSRAFLNQTILNSLDFPFCNLEEQKHVIVELESKLTVCDKIEETITNSLQQAETLRQSILKRAFEGRLI